MTRISNAAKLKKKAKSLSSLWLLQDAKARFSELVRLAQTEGPQHVTVHGQEAVVIISASEFRRLKGELSGDSLVEAMQRSPHQEVSLSSDRVELPVRRVDL